MSIWGDHISTTPDHPVPYSTLFLDRDGVINRFDRDARPESPLVLLPDVKEALITLQPLFHRMIIVTNQGSIGHGFMTLADLYGEHARLLTSFHEMNISIDHIYAAVDHVRSGSRRRKPQPGMAEEAVRDFPDIDLSRSWMVGDRMSDIKFAANAGIGHSALITHPDLDLPAALPHPDLYCDDLWTFAKLMVGR